LDETTIPRKCANCKSIRALPTRERDVRAANRGILGTFAFSKARSHNLKISISHLSNHLQNRIGGFLISRRYAEIGGSCMRTTAQIEASRRNGAKSKGPTSASGESRSSQNAIRTGLHSHKTVVIDGESKEEWEQFQREFLVRFQPRDFVEERLVIEMAVSRWRLQRVWAMQTAVMNEGTTHQLPNVLEKYESSDAILVHATAYASRKSDLEGLDRQEVRLSRIFDRAMRNLKELRAQFQPETDFENEPEPEPAAHETPAQQLEPENFKNEPETKIHPINIGRTSPRAGLQPPAAGRQPAAGPECEPL
jgi:hypothetical protein